MFSNFCMFVVHGAGRYLIILFVAYILLNVLLPSYIEGVKVNLADSRQLYVTARCANIEGECTSDLTIDRINNLEATASGVTK